MPILNVHLDGEDRRLSYAPGANLLEILQRADLPIRSACRSVGACGLCRVEIAGEGLNPPTENERIHLGRGALAEGHRLACEVLPVGDLEVRLLRPAGPSAWCGIEGLGREWDQSLAGAAPARDKPLGLAVDVGTTNLSLALVDLAGGRLLSARQGENPQQRFGADVMTRLIACTQDPQAATALKDGLLAGIEAALVALAESSGQIARDIGRLTLVGNSAMLAMLLGGPAISNLLERGESGLGVAGLSLPPASVRAMGLEDPVELRLPGPAGGFVGSDALAAVLASRICESAEPAMLVDFGTNTEVLLWDGRRLRACSAAGGPAFEGCGISCGMPAGPGAVYRLETGRDGEVHAAWWQGPGDPHALCGSALLSLVAGLLCGGQVDEAGRIAGGAPHLEFHIHGRTMRLDKRDIDALQRAKAAVSCAITTVLDDADLEGDALREVVLAGTFGCGVVVDDAIQTGLLPGAVRHRCRALPAAALEGAMRMLGPQQATLADLSRVCDVLNLADRGEFDESFLEALFLRPLTRGGVHA